MESEVKATILGLSLIVSLLALYFEEYRTLIISLSSVVLVGYILYSYLSKIERDEGRIEELEKSFKRSEGLIKIRADIESLKRRKK